MANKQYISIIRLFDYCDITTDPGFDLPRVKKQLQAEFNVSQGGFIETGGHTYTRHDVFEEIDRPDFLARLLFHKQLWNCPQILQMLETNNVDPGLLQEEFKPFWMNEEFDQFFSPYFVGPFSHMSRILLAEMEFEMMSELLVFEGFLRPAEREEAFGPLFTFFAENSRVLRNISAHNYRIMRPKMVQWIDKDWHGFLNALPEELYDAKLRLINQLISVGVAIQKTRRRDCRKMSGHLVLLSEMPENLRSVILSNHKIYSGSRLSFKWRSGFWWIWITICVVRAIGSESCNKDNSRYNGSDPTNFIIDTPLLKKLGDSSSRFQERDTALLHQLIKVRPPKE